MEPWPGVLKGFWHLMPEYYTKDTPIITLQEGNTPLIYAPKLADALKFEGKLYLKNEGANAGTNSFKDRGMTGVVSKAVEEGSKAIVCASTGNTAAASAAYAARARSLGYKMQCIILLPQGNVAKGKIVQSAMFGAKIIQVKGTYDEALDIVRELGERYPITVVNSINPYRFDGQKTAAFEICRDLGRPPDYHFIPVGNAANIVTYWQGYKEYFPEEVSPKMMGWQAAGASPIIKGRPVKNPKTFASAINIGNPSRWKDAIEAVESSGGVFGKVTENQIRRDYATIPRLAGVFCEPSSAVSVAGLRKAIKENLITNDEDTVVVCTLTGNGLKDPESGIKLMGDLDIAEATTEAVAEYIK